MVEAGHIIHNMKPCHSFSTGQRFCRSLSLHDIVPLHRHYCRPADNCRKQLPGMDELLRSSRSKGESWTGISRPRHAYSLRIFILNWGEVKINRLPLVKYKIHRHGEASWSIDYSVYINAYYYYIIIIIIISDMKRGMLGKWIYKFKKSDLSSFQHPNYWRRQHQKIHAESYLFHHHDHTRKE